jgi:site-specific DNA-methyltransferase (adenine-specific)
MPKYIDDESVDLIYIDPPFNTSRQYEVFWGEAQERRAFEDRFGDAMTYLDWMRPRIRELHRALKPAGSFYYHCDWHASHYIKVELDRVFGFNNFQNEIIWKRQTAHSDSGRYGHLHDAILFYTKSNRFTWNPEYTEYDPIYIKRYFRYRDQHGVFRSDDMTAPGGRGPRYEWKGITRNWRFTRENMEKLEAEGRIFYTKRGIPRYKRYLDEMPGTPLQSIWTDILPVVSWSSEGLGYPTQKPLALLERIIKASSNEGDVVFDAFCGCGTTLEAAAKFKRRWIGIDMSPTACRVMAQRLDKRLGLRESIDFKLIDMPKTEDDLRRIPHREFENWAVIALGGIPNEVKVGDYGIDGRLYLADIEKERKGDFFETLDKWYPIQVKQQDRAGRPDLDKFETAMRRDKRLRGYFIAFGFSADATREIKRANREDGLDIVPITVKELLEHERVAT